MKQNYTHISFIIDRSGSMYSCWDDTINGLKSFISDQKKEDLKCTFSLTVFDDEIEYPIRFEDIHKITDEYIDSLNIYPRGRTSLRDAIGSTIRFTGERLSDMYEDERPDRVMTVIQTDGRENDSKEYDAATLRQMIEHQKDKYNWNFMFIGANEEVVIDAINLYGLDSTSTTHYNINNSPDTFKVISAKIKTYRSSAVGSTDYLASMSFNDDDRNTMS
jgi:hypothetical protein